LYLDQFKLITVKITTYYGLKSQVNYYVKYLVKNWPKNCDLVLD